VVADDLIESRCDVSQRFVPTDRLEFALTLWSNPSEWMRQAIMMVGPFQIPVYLRAEETLRDRVIGIALDADRPTIFHRRNDRARVRAIMWTRAANSAGTNER
jgi:hypothetical protein